MSALHPCGSPIGPENRGAWGIALSNLLRIAMIISLNAQSNHCPPGLLFLSSDPGTPLYHNKHRLRHPRGIYLSSLHKIEERFAKVCQDLEPFLAVSNAKQVNADWFKPLLSSQEQLLYALDEHFDDCFSIFDCFFPEQSMRKKNHNVKLFIERAKPYMGKIAEVVNKMKHRNAALRGIVLSVGKLVIPGYFLEGVFPNGAVGPDPGIHKDLTAFSFSHDLRQHFVQLFATSLHLGNTLQKLGAKPASDPKWDCAWVVRLAKQLAALPANYYPNEIGLPNPWIQYEEIADGVSIVLTKGKESPLPKSFPQRGNKIVFQTTALYRGDSTTTTYKIPYSAKVSGNAT